MKHLVIASALLMTTATSFAAERIISAGSAITELVYALDAQDQLVGVDQTSKFIVASQALENSDAIEQNVKSQYVNNQYVKNQDVNNTAIPVLGYHRQLAAESLLSLNPTRILGSSEMGPQTTLTLLRQAGVAVDVLNSGETVEDLLVRIEQVGRLTQHESTAQALQKEVKDKVAAIKANQAKTETPKKVLFLMIHEGRPTNVAGRHTPADSVIQLAGAINPAADSIESYKPISQESIVEMQPDIILLSERTFSQLGSVESLLQKMPMLAATPAGQNQAVVTIDGTALIGGLGIQSLNEAERLNREFYPQSF